MSKLPWLSGPARVYISILRGMPVLVLLMLIFYVVFASVDIDPLLVAIIAFGMNFAAYVSEIFRTGIEGVDRGQTEAGIAMGFCKVQTFLHVVLPQTVQRILPVYKGEFISLVKMTSIVGYIAVQDLTKASDIIRSRTFDAFFPLIMVALLYFLISLGPHAVAGASRTRYRSEIQARQGGTRMIKVEHLSKSFGDLTVLKDITTEIQKGEVVSIIGPSGTGKSTFLRCLNLLEHPTSGSIHIDGVDILDKKTDVVEDAAEDEHGVPVVQPVRASVGAGEPDARPDQAARAWTAGAARKKSLELLKLVGLARRRMRTRTSCPAARSSASRSPAAWRWTRRSSCSTSRRRRSIPPW